MFVMLWAYLEFSQYLIIWGENLSGEIPWYLRRMQGGWGGSGLGLVFLNFALPFILLSIPACKAPREFFADGRDAGAGHAPGGHMLDGASGIRRFAACVAAGMDGGAAAAGNRRPVVRIFHVAIAAHAAVAGE